MSLEQHKVMHAIEICRTEALGGHVDQCDTCGHQVISYNSCRNRHCPKCQSLAKAQWLDARQAEVLPVDYYHLVFTLPDLLGQLALQNQKELYDILFASASKTLQTIAADPKHLGAKIGFVAVLHTWGQNLLQHSHVHCLVPGGGISPNGQKWIASKPGFFLPVKVLSRLFRRLFLESLEKAFKKGKLKFFGNLKDLAQPTAFECLVNSCRKVEWVVFSKPPFGGPEKVLDYLGRYAYRIAISNHRLLSMNDGKVSFTWKNYKKGGKQQIMTLQAHEFIRRFLMHTLPNGFVRIRYYGLFANCHRKEKLQICRNVLNVPDKVEPREKMNWIERFIALTGKDPLVCPKCKKGRLSRIRQLARVTSVHDVSEINEGDTS